MDGRHVTGSSYYNTIPSPRTRPAASNSHFEMPFRRCARAVLQNLAPEEVKGFYYQIDYTLREVPADRAYLHAQWRRYLPLQDDIASTAFWYQAEPHAPIPALPDLNGLEVIQAFVIAWKDGFSARYSSR